jgi:hypothetical protein
MSGAVILQHTPVPHLPCCLNIRDACREHHVRNPVRV